MKTISTIWAAAILLGAASLVACGDDGGSGGAGGGAGTTSASGSTSGTPTGSTGGTGGDPTGPGTGGEGGEGGAAPVFVFADNAYSDYQQIDRHGAVEAGTAGIAASEGLGDETTTIRDDYNASNPEEDADGDWIPQIAASVGFFRALDGDLELAGLVPATNELTLAQAGPVIRPDTIKYDPDADVGYPNGRALTDQVVDITLAAVLLDLSEETGNGQTIRTFADLDLDPDDGVNGLNPPANDVEFEDSFPFLAAPNEE